MGSLRNSVKHTKKNLYWSFSTSWLKRSKHSHSHSMWPPSSSWYQNLTKQHQGKKLQDSIFDEYRCKNSQQNISKPNSVRHKKIIHHEHTGFIPGSRGWFKIHKSNNMIHHINKRKDKNHMVISTDAEKAFVKFNIHLWIKTLTKVSIKKMYLNITAFINTFSTYLWQI